MKRISFFILILIALGGCIKDTGDRCNYNECGKVAPASEQQDVEDYLDSLGITNWQKHCSGLYYVVDNLGMGDTVNFCSLVHVDHTGKLIDGTTFTSGEFSTDMSVLIPGWRNGLTKIQEGGRIRLFIPPTLGYGEEQYGPIPPNSILIYTVDLKAVY